MLNIALIVTATLVECTSLVLYNRYKSRVRKLRKTGRITDIEIAHNWQSFFGFVLLAIPCLLIYAY
jgi:hypothetical protein